MAGRESVLGLRPKGNAPEGQNVCRKRKKSRGLHGIAGNGGEGISFGFKAKR